MHINEQRITITCNVLSTIFDTQRQSVKHSATCGDI